MLVYLSLGGANRVTGDGPTCKSEVRVEDIQYSVQSGSSGRHGNRIGHQDAPWSTEYSTSTSDNHTQEFLYNGEANEGLKYIYIKMPASHCSCIFKIPEK